MIPNLDSLPPTLPVWRDDLSEPSGRWLFPDLSRGTLYEACRRGEIPSARVRGRLLVLTRPALRMLDGQPAHPSEAA
jgi:hypothetical protein